jgi:acetyl esterase/lipase
MTSLLPAHESGIIWINFPPGITNHRFFHRMNLVLAILFFLCKEKVFSNVDPTYKDIIYATVNGKDLNLDLYLPSGVSNPSLLVWVHGGAWRSGSKASVPKFFVENGIAVASLDFRQSTEAKFPANVHDIKAAIRFLRAKASEYGYRTDRIGIAGSSSGGHLAALVGVSNKSSDLEGRVGNYLKESSEVHAIIDYFGASNLSSILSQSTPHGLNVRKPALDLLLGGQPDQVPELARLASPVFHIDKSDPPLLIIHGDQDPQMPINQSHELEGQYRKLDLDVHFEVIHGAAHGGDVFFSEEYVKLAIDFLRRALGD